MIVLTSLTAGVWRHPELVLVRSLEDSSWAVDGAFVPVYVDLVVGFHDQIAAAWMLDQGRADLVSVVPGQVVNFYDDYAVEFFVESGLAELFSVDASVEHGVEPSPTKLSRRKKDARIHG